jgi:hypothetical protein
VAKKRQVVAGRLLENASVLQGRHLLNITVGPDLCPVLLSLDRQPEYRIETDHGSFSRARATSPNHFRIHHLVGHSRESLDLAPTSENYHFVQPLPGGRWLLVRSRAEGEADCNAHVHGPDGGRIASFHAGDGIEDVQVTDQGHAWVSYFDEGVFGDTSLGRNGLVSLDAGGTPVFRFGDLIGLATPVIHPSGLAGTHFGDLAGSVLGSMADCYALNVCSGKEVWLCYYTDFPMVQLIEGTISGWWSMPVHGSHGFAVCGGRALLGGGYDRADSLFLGNLGASNFQELTPVSEAGQPLKRFRAFGRRHRLFLATDTALHAVDLPSL